MEIDFVHKVIIKLHCSLRLPTYIDRNIYTRTYIHIYNSYIYIYIYTYSISQCIELRDSLYIHRDRREREKRIGTGLFEFTSYYIAAIYSLPL